MKVAGWRRGFGGWQGASEEHSQWFCDERATPPAAKRTSQVATLIHFRLLSRDSLSPPPSLVNPPQFLGRSAQPVTQAHPAHPTVGP